MRLNTKNIDQMKAFSEVGIGDEAIDQENMQKIQSMSRADILAAQKSLLEQLGASHVNALNKFKNNFGKKGASRQKSVTHGKQQQSRQEDDLLEAPGEIDEQE